MLERYYFEFPVGYCTAQRGGEGAGNFGGKVGYVRAQISTNEALFRSKSLRTAGFHSQEVRAAYVGAAMKRRHVTTRPGPSKLKKVERPVLCRGVRFRSSSQALCFSCTLWTTSTSLPFGANDGCSGADTVQFYQVCFRKVL